MDPGSVSLVYQVRILSWCWIPYGTDATRQVYQVLLLVRLK